MRVGRGDGIRWPVIFHCSKLGCRSILDLVVHLHHRQLDVTLEGKTPSSRLFVHELKQVVTFEVAPLFDRLIENVDIVGQRFVQEFEKSRLARADVAFDDQLCVK